MIGIFFFICLLVSCSSEAGRQETIPAESLLRQAAFYEERLQYLPALAMYQQAARLAEKEKDSVALSSVYQRMGNIYRNQSLKHEALQCEKKALSYISNANDSLRMELYREIGDIHALTGEADSACYYYQIGGCRISQAKILQQGGRCREAELLLKEELEQDISKEEKAELCLALADLKISSGELEEAEDYLSHVPASHPHVYAAGDITGFSLLAHTAYREAEVAIHHILGIPDEMSYKAIPAVVYTNPELASVGKTEEELIANGESFRVQKIPMTYSGRFVAENENGNGLCKLITDDEDRIIGCHLLGNPASEIIVTAGIAVENGYTVDEFKKNIFPHPTVSEILHESLYI